MAARKKKRKAKKRARRRAPAPERRWSGVRLSLAALRIYVGAAFVDGVIYKLTANGKPLWDAIDDFATHEYTQLIEAAIAAPPDVLGWRLQWYADFLEGVMLAQPALFAGLILLAELALGISLVLGAGVRLSSVLGALLMAAFGLAKRAHVLSLAHTNWLLVMVLLLFAALAAGRVFGLDARLQHRLPRWIA